VNPCFDVGFNPSAENAAARKHDWMHAICIDYRQFQIAIKWRSRYRMPHESPRQNLAALMWVVPGYSGISPELKFVNLVVVLRAKPAEQAGGCRQNDQLGALL
jgi:hypothetical protein